MLCGPEKPAYSPLSISTAEKDFKTPSGTPMNKCKTTLEHTKITCQRTKVTETRKTFFLSIYKFTVWVTPSNLPHQHLPPNKILGPRYPRLLGY